MIIEACSRYFLNFERSLTSLHFKLKITSTDIMSINVKNYLVSGLTHSHYMTLFEKKTILPCFKIS